MNVTQGDSLRGIDKNPVRRLGLLKKTVCYFLSKQNGPKRTCVQFMSYSKCSDCRLVLDIEIGIELWMFIYFLLFCWDKFIKN